MGMKLYDHLFRGVMRFEVKGGVGSGRQGHSTTGINRPRRPRMTMDQARAGLDAIGHDIDFNSAQHDGGVTTYNVTHRTSGKVTRVSARGIMDFIGSSKAWDESLHPRDAGEAGRSAAQELA